MAAAVTDKFIKGPANKSSTLSSSISDSVQTIPISDLTGVPTDTAVYAAIDAHDSSGTATPSTKEVVKGVVSGSNLINCTRGAEGTAQSHSAGAVVEFFFTAAANNDIVDGLLVEHGQDGTHDSSTVGLLAGTQTFTGDKTFSGAATFSGTFTAPNDSITDAMRPRLKTCKVYNNTTQSVNSASQTILVYNTEVVDAEGWFNSGSSTSKIIPDEAGLYLITAQVTMTVSFNTEYVNLEIFVDNASVTPPIKQVISFNNLGSGGDGNTIQASGIAVLAANDEITAKFQHNHGSARDVTNATLTVVKLSD